MAHALNTKREPLRLGLAVAIALVAVALWFADAFEPAEDTFTTARAEMLHRPPSGQTAIVEIDAKSLAELQTWPWSRSNHAALVRKLHNADAEIIALDVDFSARSEPAADRALADALRVAAPVILPIFQQQRSDQATEGAKLVSRPAPIFDGAWIGGVNIFPGSDGLVREYPAATYIDGNIQPSIATLLAEEDSLGDRSFQPDWGIDADRIPRFSYIDVLRDRVPASAMAGKRILVGATAIELGDRYAVPRHGLTPGVVIQAIAAESLLQGRAIQRSGAIPTLGMILIVVLLLGAARYRSLLGYFSTAAPVVGAMIAGPIIVQALWPISIDSAAPLAVAAACIGARSVIELRRRGRLRALFDADSGLPNRLMLDKRLREGEGAGMMVVAASVDRFEVIRDTVGIGAASELIRGTADRIRPLTGENIFRIAPDTIAWVGPATDHAGFNAKATQIADSLRVPVETSAGVVDVALRIGVDADGADAKPEVRIERAMVAIGNARSSGRPFEWYKGADPDLRRQLSMMSDLRKGLANREVQLFYQPKLSLRNNRIEDAEALVRWLHPIDGSISPDEFIPLAEETGVVRELTEFALRRAMEDGARWHAMGKKMRIAVNVSAADIAAPDFPQLVARLLAEHALSPEHLALEVTESAIIRSPTTAIAVLGELRAQGVRLSVDDYGTGQSTLSYLKQLPVHELKIDRSFVTSICRNPADAIMVRSTIDLAHELGLDVVAEGVEDQATLTELKNLNCDYAQGYEVGKPVPFEKFG